MPLSVFATTVAIIGDSISVGAGATNMHGYVDILNERYISEGKDVKILNRSYGGARTNTGDQIVVDLITSMKIDYLVINLGINDAGANIPQAELVHNLDTMTWKAQGMGAKVIIGGVITARVNPAYQPILQVAYDHLIGHRHVIPYVFLTPEIVHYYSPDGIHPDDTGHKMIADELYKILENAGVK